MDFHRPNAAPRSTLRPSPLYRPNRNRRFGIIPLLLALLLCALPTIFAQKTIHIPADQPTIQAGINAAANGDTVLVAPGTYYENINFNGKAITVVSSSGAATTIIDGKLLNPAVSLGTSSSTPAVLDGFTVQRGVPANPTGTFSQLGGGVVTVGSATVQNNIVTNNESCGIDIANFGIVLVQFNHVYNNGLVTAPSSGGTSGCHIDGAGIDFILAMSTNFSVPQVSIIGNLVESNAGPGISGDFEGNSMAILGNTIRNNDGLGIASLSLSGPGVIAGNLIYGNAGIGLQAEFNIPSTLSIINNTLYQNGGQSTNNSLDASELLLSGGAIQVVNNIILHANSAQEPVVACTPDFASPLPVAFDHNDIYNTAGAATISGCLISGYGNRQEDPLFTNAAAANFQLLVSSPELDSGNNSAAALPATDLAANPRIQDATGKGYPIVDLGAYESSGAQEYSSTLARLIACTTTPQTGSSLLLTAILTSPLGTPSGSAALTMDLANSPYATASLDPTGHVSFTVPAIAAGLHSFVVSYSGTKPFTPATSVVLYVYAQATPSTCAQPAAATTTTLTSSLNPASYGQSVTFTALVTAASTIPTGTATFYDGTTSLGSSTLDATGHASFTTTTLGVGTHSLSAVYAGNASYAASTSPALSEIIQLNPTSTTLTASPNPASAFQFFTVTVQVASLTTVPLSAQPCAPACTVTFTITGLPANNPSTVSAPVLANGTVTIREAFAAGTYTFAASFNGSAAFAPSSSGAAITETVVPAATMLVLTASPNPANQGQTVNLATSFTAPLSTESPTGSFTYYDGTVAIGTAPFVGGPLTNATSAALAINTLPPGSHTITASYAGNANFLASTSAPVIVVINPQDFTITLASPGLTIQTQHHTTTSITLTSINGFADTLTISCANLTAYVTCRPSPSPATLSASGTATVSLYLDTDATLGYARMYPIPRLQADSPINLAFLLPPITLIAGVFMFPRRMNRRLTYVRLVMFALIALPFSLAFSGCGRLVVASDIPPSATPGTYSIPITATGNSAGVSHTVTLVLTVTP